MEQIEQTVPEFCVRDFAIAVAMGPADPSDEQLRGMLVAATDIPAEKIDQILHEMKVADLIPLCRTMATVTEMALGRKPTADELSEVFQALTWKDDGIASTNVNMTIEGLDGTTAEINIKRNR